MDSFMTQYKGGGTIGGRIGCAFSIPVGFITFFILMVPDFLGDCHPADPCSKNSEWKFWENVAIAITVTLILSLALRFVINLFSKR